jgi:ribosomal protein S18 acetylase RimI-like enzyme
MWRRELDFMRDYDQVAAMYRLSWDINFPQQELHDDAFRQWLRAGARAHEIWVYERGDDLVGWLWLDWSMPHNAHVVHVQVSEEHWGEGLGQAIMQDALALCRARGRQVLTLNATKANTRAVALYQRLGFVVTEDEGTRQKMSLELA